MTSQNKPSLPVIKRLPRYYRYLGEMEKEGIVKVSSSELAHVMGTTASQVRQDFNCFGGFGQQGIGYNVKLLREELGKLIFARQPIPTILIGAGNLGHAMANYLVEDKRGFELQGAFDVKSEMIGLTLCGVLIRDMGELGAFCAEHNSRVAVICVPRDSAKKVARQLIDLGIRAFWNFSHYDFSIDYPDVVVENVHLSDSLSTLSYEVNNS